MKITYFEIYFNLFSFSTLINLFSFSIKYLEILTNLTHISFRIAITRSRSREQTDAIELADIGTETPID